MARQESGQVRCLKEHQPSDDAEKKYEVLKQRFDELGEVAARFFAGLIQRRRYGKAEAHQILALLETYHRRDLLTALERAVRYGAYSRSAIERILAVMATPKTALERLADQEQQQLQALFGDGSVQPRSGKEYQELFDERPSETPDDEPTENRRRRNIQDQQQRILSHLETLGVSLTEEQLGRVLREAEQGGWSHLQLLDRLFAEPAAQKRERSVARRIRDAHFPENKTLESFDWAVQCPGDRSSADRRIGHGRVYPPCGQPAHGGPKRHREKSSFRRNRPACLSALGYRVRYVASDELLADLGASLADGTTPKRIRYYTRFDLLIIDGFGFDRIERQESPQALSLLYKVIDKRNPRRSTALITNIDLRCLERVPRRPADGHGLAGSAPGSGDSPETSPTPSPTAFTGHGASRPARARVPAALPPRRNHGERAKTAEGTPCQESTTLPFALASRFWTSWDWSTFNLFAAAETACVVSVPCNAAKTHVGSSSTSPPIDITAIPVIASAIS